MKKILRSLGLIAAIVGSVGLGSTPGVAGPGAVAFVGEASIVCFGCGVSSGTAELCAEGYNDPDVVIAPCADPGQVEAWAAHAIANPVDVNPLPINGNVVATYQVVEIPSQCPVTGSATGSTAGAVEVDFTWTRVGTTAVITTQGDINGGGVAVFEVTDPIGGACGNPVTAVVAGAIAGT